MDSSGRTLLDVLVSLPIEYTDMIVDVAQRIANAQSVDAVDIESELKSYRDELELEKRHAAQSSASPDTAEENA